MRQRTRIARISRATKTPSSLSDEGLRRPALHAVQRDDQEGRDFARYAPGVYSPSTAPPKACAADRATESPMSPLTTAVAYERHCVASASYQYPTGRPFSQTTDV